LELTWLAAPVKTLSVAASGPSPERLSRLRAQLQPRFEELLGEATRRGRPPRPPEATDESVLLRELLALVPRETWSFLATDQKLRLVEAHARLKEEHGLSAKRFCDLLGISERTFRGWKRKLSKPAKDSTSPGATDDPESASSDDSDERKNNRATGRFDLEVTLPGVQTVADTTYWEFLDVPLRVVGTQDPGQRKERLWESFAIDTSEDSDLVIQAIAEATKDREGSQVITDQGSPYMSEATEAALETLECEHAPQREGRPTDKATKERAFRTVKEALAPVVDLSRRLARRFPVLKKPSLARRIGKLLLSVYLHVYEAAPRVAGHPLAGRDAEELRAIVEEQRDKARMEGRSKRLLLKAIHREYHLNGSPERFVRTYRDHALEDIQQAERELRRKACRCRTRACDQYFGGILRNVAEKNGQRRSQERRLVLRQAEQRRWLKQGTDLLRQRRQLGREDPHALLAEGLDLIAIQWQADTESLFAGGEGLGVALLGMALSGIESQDELAVPDRAEAAFQLWRARRPGDSAGLQDAVHDILRRELAPFRRQTPFTPQLVRDRILHNRPMNTKTRPHIARPCLRN